MAQSRRALLRKGNVTDIAEARKQRELKQQAKQEALANARISTLEEATRQADAIKAAALLDAAGNTSFGEHMSTATQTYAVAGGNSNGRNLATGSTARSPGTSSTQSTASSSSGGSNLSRIADSATSQPTDNASEEVSKKKKHGNRTYNTEKVEAIKKAIAEGTYTINPQRIADKFIEREAPA